MATFLESFGSGLGGSLGSSIVGSVVPSSQTTTQNSRRQKVLTQEGIDKIVYDIMASDQGLASLANAENASGGYRSSSKSLLAQDLIAKVAGEIANITAPEVTESKSKTKKGTVICTALMYQGKLDKQLYADGAEYYHKLNDRVVRGYHRWAFGVVDLMIKYPKLQDILAPIAVGRYEMITGRKTTFWGLATIYIGEPICWLISFLPQRKEVVYG